MTLKYIIAGEPRTKKNHMQLARTKDGRVFPIQSSQYLEYEKWCKAHLKKPTAPIETPVTVSVKYFMKTKRRVDITNLLGATDDILVECRILADDNCNIIKSHDGSRVYFDKDNPRAEITITDYVEGENENNP